MENTYLGQTAGGILKSATIVKMQAGNVEIVVKDSKGRELQAFLGERGVFGGSRVCDVMVLSGVEGVVARLATSAAAYEKLVALQSQTEKAMLGNA